MDLMGLCSMCGKPSALFTCHICGKLVCAQCFDQHHGVCQGCKQGKR